MGAVVLLSTYQSDQESFNQTLNNLGAFGGFLSGIGTIIVAAAATVGVDTWYKQLKNEKILTSIWDAQVLVSKIETEFHFGAVFYNSNVPDLRKQSEQSEKEIYSCLKALEELAHVFDSLSPKSDEVWGNNIRGLKMLWSNYKRYLDTTDFSQTDMNYLTAQAVKSLQLSNDKKSYIDELRTKLNKLEKKQR